MKILHLNTFQHGGAALCAQRINKALVAQGVDSKMLFAAGGNLPEGIKGAVAVPDKIFLYSNPFLAKIRHLIMRLPWYMDCEKMTKIIEEKNAERIFASSPYTNFKNIANHPLIKWADIIHLHWVTGFVDYPSFFRNVKKPIVWTLHDENPAIGIMHFCSEFSPLPKELEDIDRKCIDVKRRSVAKAQSLNTIAISMQMKHLCMSSEILQPYPCMLIHNGVDTELFHRYNECNSDCLTTAGFRNNQKNKVFLFSSYSILDRRKGLLRVIEALEKINDKEISLIVIGACRDVEIPKSTFPVFYTGLVNNQTELAKIYSAADYFIQASYQEAFAQTPLEAMACGTPVISTPVSGASDLIQPFNGVVCKGFSSENLKDGIVEAMSHTYYAQQIRDYIIENYDYSKIAREYIALYNSIVPL